MVSVNGSVSSGYEGVKDAFAANFNDDSLKMKRTSDAIITAGVAPK